MNLEALRSGIPQHGIMFRALQGCGPMQMVKDAGFDFVLLDLEHGGYSRETLSDMLLFGRCASLGTVVRVPALARAEISRALDCGARGIMVPMLSTAEQARALVRWTKYAPVGERGLSSAGGHSLFRKIRDAVEFMATENQEILAIAQIETKEAINQINEIASTPGLDALLIGPNDLAVSLGQAGNFEAPEVDQSINRVASVCADHGKIFGMHGPPFLLQRWLPKGLSLMVNGLDIDALAEGIGKISRQSRNLIDEWSPSSSLTHPDNLKNKAQ